MWGEESAPIQHKSRLSDCKLNALCVLGVHCRLVELKEGVVQELEGYARLRTGVKDAKDRRTIQGHLQFICYYGQLFHSFLIPFLGQRQTRGARRNRGKRTISDEFESAATALICVSIGDASSLLAPGDDDFPRSTKFHRSGNMDGP